MKIAILTEKLSSNYGGILQAYAMQKVLYKMGHTPLTIDLSLNISIWQYLLSQTKTLIFYCTFHNSRKFFRYHHNERPQHFNEFIQSHIRTTKAVYKYKASTLKKNNIEGIIVGSDQVWRKAFHSDNIQQDLFLRFAQKLKIPKIAYAASFGTDKWEYPMYLTTKCMKYAQTFTAISTREKSGIELCRKYLNVSAIQMPDPTLLINKNEYAKLCKNIPRKNESFLLAYILDLDANKKCYIEKKANQMGLKARFCTADKDSTLSIEEWLAMFRDASFVITNSFHGTVFSIINNINFYTIINEWRGTDRFTSLLSHFNLMDRLFNNIDLLPENVTTIDWHRINEIKDRWADEGYNYLNKYLKTKNLSFE